MKNFFIIKKLNIFYYLIFLLTYFFNLFIQYLHELTYDDDNNTYLILKDP